MSDPNRRPPSAEELVATVRRIDLLDSGHLEELSRYHQANRPDPSSLTQWMRTRGLVTEFQATQLLTGQAGKLALGPYRLLEPLGEGGMGHVYKARHQRLGRLVALKVIRPELKEVQGEALRRFQREARAAAQLQHPNVVTLYDADEVNGLHFIAMEYVDGTDLSRLVANSGPLGVAQACDYIRQAALGLQHASDHGLVHRDIKPANLLLSRKSITDSDVMGLTPTSSRPAASAPAYGQIKVLDLGLVRLNRAVSDDLPLSELTQQGAVLGTPDFIAPEQARNPSAVDIRADLYSLGCTLYFLLAGTPPFPEGSAVEKLLKHQLDAPRPVEARRPDTPPVVAAIVRRLMAKRPADRYQTPLELAADLEAVSRLPEVAAPADTPRHTSNPATVTSSPTAALPSPQPAAWDQSSRFSAPTILHAPAVYFPAQRVAHLSGHAGCLNALTYSDDGTHLLTAGIDQTVRVWNPRGQLLPEVAVLHHPYGELHALACAPGQPFVMAGASSPNGPLCRWDWTRPSAGAQVVGQGGQGGLQQLAYSPDGQRLAAADGEGAVLWAVKDRGLAKRTALQGHARDTQAVAFGPDNRQFATGGANGVIDLWEIGRIWTRQRNVLAGHHDAVTALAYSPDGKLLVSGGIDQSVRVWDATGTEAEERKILPGMLRPVRALRFVADGQRLLAADDAGHVAMWDVTSWAKVREWLVDKTLITRLALSPDGRELATTGSDGTVILFKLALA